jgi:predicted HAD superfamily Cof-like phosphohydrolase
MSCTDRVEPTMGGVLLSTQNWFRKAIPHPTDQNLHTQLGVHFEEVGEMLETLTSENLHTAYLVERAEEAMKALASHLKGNQGVIKVSNLHEMLDALCDQLVTTTGTAHMLHLNIIGGLDEVNRSNWSKFVDGEPVFDANMKIQKGPNYFKADLSTFVPEFTG